MLSTDLLVYCEGQGWAARRSAALRTAPTGSTAAMGHPMPCFVTLLILSAFSLLAALDINDFAGSYTVNTPETIAYLKRASEAPGNSIRQQKLYGLLVQKLSDGKSMGGDYTVTTTEISVQMQERTVRHSFGEITADAKTVTAAIIYEQGEVQQEAKLVFESTGNDRVLLKSVAYDVDVPLVLTRKAK